MLSILDQRRGAGRAASWEEWLSTSWEAGKLTASARDRVPGVTEDVLPDSLGSPPEGHQNSQPASWLWNRAQFLQLNTQQSS